MADRGDIVSVDQHRESRAESARYRVTRCARDSDGAQVGNALARGAGSAGAGSAGAGESASWESDDPRIVFALILEHERARRAGARPPRVTVEWSGSADPAMLDAVRRHAPWVELHAAESLRSRPSTAAESPPPASFTLTQAELSMLFGGAAGDAEPA